MFRPRPFVAPCLKRQFLSSPSLHLHQVRCKTIKHLYKGGRPRQPRKPPVVASVQKEAKIKAEPEKPSIPPKKPRDPLQGMREAAARENFYKYTPPTPEKSAISTPEPVTVGPSSSTTTEKTTQTVPKQVFAEPTIPPAPGSLGNRPIPPPSSSRQIPPGGQGDRRWMYYAMAAIFAVGGAYLFFSSPSPRVVHARKDIAEATSEPIPKNVVEAISILKEVFGDRCSTEEDDLEEFSGAGIMNIGGGSKPRAIVWPESTRDVEIILRTANTYNVPIIPYSGGTSLEGQCVPVSDAITVSMTRMNKIIALRPHDMDITLQPGISWNDLNVFLKPYGFFFPVDPGPNAHIGGMISTSASGTNAVKYGTMKDWVLNLTVVLPGGHVLRTRGRARKSSTGYDLTRLFCGSEGTLGIITEATLKLAHLPEKEVVGAIAFQSNTAAANSVSKILSAGIEPRCIELLDSTCIDVVNQSLTNVPKFPVQPHIFFKLTGQASTISQQQSLLTSILKKSGGTQLRIAKNEKEGEQLWEIRKTLAYTLVSAFPGTEVVSTDVCVPISRLAGLIEQYKLDQDRINQEMRDAGEKGQLNSLILGHVGDGNFHSMIAFEKGNTEMKKRAQQLENTVVANALAMDGTASGEHGVGIHKLEFVRDEYDPAALTLMRAIKAGIDPKNIMNPGTLLPPIHKGDTPYTAATIDLQSINEWIVRPESLTAPAEVEPRRDSAVNEKGESLLGRSWSEIKKLGDGAANAFGVINTDSRKSTDEIASRGWKEQGDGA